MPWGITVAPSGDIYVADWGNDRIAQFTAAGEFLASYGEPGRGEGQLVKPASVAVDTAGNIYVADWGNERVQAFDPDGTSSSFCAARRRYPLGRSTSSASTAKKAKRAPAPT